MSRTFWLVLCCYSSLAYSSSLRADLREVETLVGETMGTTYTIRLVVPPNLSQEQLSSQVQEVLNRINSRMSTYLDDSELTQFNHQEGTDWFSVSEETATVVAKALEIAQLSGGNFDPTVGRLVRLWHFGPGLPSTEPPTEEEIAHARQSVGYQLISVRTSPPALKKDHPAAELDLSAIAKGYAVDAVSRTLSDLGATSSMVEIGGEIRTVGSKPDGSLWRIAIERPDEQGQSIEKILELSDTSIATSGDYRNYFESNGQRFSHTIDPETGKPVTHQLASVSVLADDCMTADALATALMVLGPDAGKELANTHQIAAFFLIRTESGFATEVSNEGQVRFKFLSPEEMKVIANRAASGRNIWRTFGLTLGIFALAILGLAAGVLLSRRPLKGTCGGMSGAGGESPCMLCSRPKEECDEFRRRMPAAAEVSEEDQG